MVYEGVLEGRFVNLRSVREDDAEFILNIRNNPEISKYLPPLNVTVEQQRAWITKQRADNDSYYFIIEDNKKLQSLGTISIYDIELTHGESGRLCSIGEPCANIEAIYLFNYFVFEILKFEYMCGWVIAGNAPVSSLNKKFGYVPNGKSLTKDGRECETLILTKKIHFEKSRKIKKLIDTFNM